MVYVETPANPTNDLIDLEMCAKLAARFTTSERTVPWRSTTPSSDRSSRSPSQHGADIVLYSATKYLGGHGDLIAGLALGSHEVIDPIRAMRTFTGNMVNPFTAWLLMRSMATLGLRMERQADTARKVADYLRDHPKVEPSTTSATCSRAIPGTTSTSASASAPVG